MKKIVRITIGFILIPVGLVLSIPGIPGPGLAIAFVGLVMLADYFEWARRMVAWTKAKFHKILHRDKAPAESKPADSP
ncbi:MAG: PGPGW domain-containing protein [Bryobacteraceae bacterium]|nr:PGPGW domain-containing protein [Bryobacteraceae bacterium]